MSTSPNAIAARRPVALAVFLALTFGLSWLAFLPIILGAVEPTSTAGVLFLPLVGVGSPSIAAVVVSGLVGGRAGVSTLLRAGGRRRVGIRWCAVVVFLPLVAYAVFLIAVLGSTGGFPRLDSTLEVWIAAVVSGLLAGTLEEFGWSGFAFPALRARFGVLSAGAAMGVIVAVWHVPLSSPRGSRSDPSPSCRFCSR